MGKIANNKFLNKTLTGDEEAGPFADGDPIYTYENIINYLTVKGTYTNNQLVMEEDVSYNPPTPEMNIITLTLVEAGNYTNISALAKYSVASTLTITVTLSISTGNKSFDVTIRKGTDSGGRFASVDFNNVNGIYDATVTPIGDTTYSYQLSW